MAWISTDDVTPSIRFTQSSVPYKRLDGAIVADSWDTLTEGNFDNPISMAETGEFIGGLPIWTNTSPNGETGTEHDCTGWTQEVGSALIGLSNETQLGLWTLSEFLDCEQSARLYCFEQ